VNFARHRNQRGDNLAFDPAALADNQPLLGAYGAADLAVNAESARQFQRAFELHTFVEEPNPVFGAAGALLDPIHFIAHPCLLLVCGADILVCRPNYSPVSVSPVSQRTSNQAIGIRHQFGPCTGCPQVLHLLFPGAPGV
jgi:hypothetical protein